MATPGGKISPARYLLGLQPGYTPEALEAALTDLVDLLPAGEQRERALAAELLHLLKTLRRGRKVSTGEILFVEI